MNILAVDYGAKSIGLAKYMDAVKVVLPYGQVSNLSGLIDIIKKEKINLVVMGLPISLDNAESKNEKKVREFGQTIKDQTGVNLKYVDERFSSQQADRMARGVSRDEKSAMIILQTYLDKNYQ